ncbi:hypothetical protein JT55_10780 [Rhodovulum sp. NI22]|nr:hypothetical protein JT55_10780 [Rhodovulum sp. NI22]
MVASVASQRLVYRVVFGLLGAVLIFLYLLPLDTTPGRFPGPDLLLCLAFAWVQRRPDFLPPFLLVGVFLMADMLLMRPPGLWTALVLLGAEFLRSRHGGTGELPFPAEWAFTAMVIAAISLVYMLVLSLFAVDHGQPVMALMRAALTIAFYPLVVVFCHHGLTLRRLSPGDVDPHGVPR